MEDEFEQGFNYEIETEGMQQGAEARVYICTYLGRPAIMKERWVCFYFVNSHYLNSNFQVCQKVPSPCPWWETQ